MLWVGMGGHRSLWMVISPKLWLIFGVMLMRHSYDDWSLCGQKEIIKRVG